MNQTLNVRHVKCEHPIYVTEIRIQSADAFPVLMTSLSAITINYL
jgi:hypothetical protein